MKLFKYIHFLSLDVCLGAIAYQYYFYHLRLHTTISLPFQILLFCSVWFVYLMDRLIDVHLDSINDRRHQFILKNKRNVYILFLIVGIIILLEMMKISTRSIMQGLLLVFGVGVYWFFWIQQWFGKYLSKEFFTAILYTLGILYPWDSLYTFQSILLVFVFFLIVLHHLKVFLHIAGKSVGTDLVLIEVFLVISLVICFVLWGNQLVELIPLCITLGVQLIIRYFYPYGRMKAIAEIAYWSPILLIIYELL